MVLVLGLLNTATIVEKTFVTTFRAEVPDAGEFEGTPEITPQPGLFAQPEVRGVMFGLGLKGKVKGSGFRPRGMG